MRGLLGLALLAVQPSVDIGPANKTASVPALSAGQCPIRGLLQPGSAPDKRPRVLHSGPVLGFSAVPDAQETAIDAVVADYAGRIVTYAGLDMNFDLMPYGTPNAAAVVVNGRREILYNPAFFAKLNDNVCPDWGVLSVLAHEIGHHLQGHTLRYSPDPLRDELEADEFSGFILQRMGADLDDALRTAEALMPEQTTAGHPPRAQRVAAISRGWNDARAIATLPIASARQAASDRMQPQLGYIAADPDDGDPMAVVSRVDFSRDETIYLVTRGNFIIAHKGAQRYIIGRREKPVSSDYAWSFRTAYVAFDVDFAGRVYRRLPDGTPVTIGEVVAP